MPTQTLWIPDDLFIRLKGAVKARGSSLSETACHLITLGMDQVNLLSNEASALVDVEMQKLGQRRWQVLSDLVIDGYQWRAIRELKKKKLYKR